MIPKHRLSTFMSVKVFNPLVRTSARAGISAFGIGLLETTGRRSGRPRQTPVGLSVEGDTAWLVAEHGRRAAYVRNLEADPRVRVLWSRRWRAGLAHIVDDDPRERLRRMPRIHAASVRAMGTELLTIRIDLENEKDAKVAA
jgi:deazaflavin-dependent oxidoreductase (nitroreductase family)